MTTELPVPEPFKRPLRLGVLISGGGTTLQNFIDRIAAGLMRAEIALVIAGRNGCRGIERAEAAGLPCSVIPQSAFQETAAFSREIFQHLRAAKVDLVTLAGFLQRIEIPDDFRLRVMNIHPALIPAFCGKGFYGERVHAAAIKRGVKLSGCTVHFADNEYDHGPIILQHAVPVYADDAPAELAARVFAVECEAYPEAIELFAAGRLEIIEGRVRVRDANG